MVGERAQLTDLVNSEVSLSYKCNDILDRSWLARKVKVRLELKPEETEDIGDQCRARDGKEDKGDDLRDLWSQRPPSLMNEMERVSSLPRLCWGDEEPD